MTPGAAYLLGMIVIGGGTILVYFFILWIEYRIFRCISRNFYRYVTKEKYKDDMTYVNHKPYTVEDLLRKNK
jgi:hypothetical protein